MQASGFPFSRVALEKQQTAKGERRYAQVPMSKVSFLKNS